MRLPFALLTLVYCTLIFWMSSQPVPDPIERIRIPHKDKLFHAVLYGGLAATVSMGLRKSGRRVRPPRQFWLPFLFAALYGVTDEIHQYFVPERSFDFADMVANGVGALIAQLVLCMFVWRIPFRELLR